MTDPRDDPSARDQVTRELEPGEHLLWSGRGDPSVLFTGRDAFLVPFSIIWCAFVAFWLATAVSSGAPWFFVLFGGVFALVGLHMLLGRFVVKRHRKRVTAYAITDRRVLVTAAGRTRETPVRRTDHTTSWSRDRRHCSVEWTSVVAGGTFGNRAVNAQVYRNTGLDGLFGPQELAFWDVADGDALVAALRTAERGPA
ncbi:MULTISPECIES: hypothetical protein [unclassified Curtobacterium]|uniref:hypothetical protein n=1 Tax=unclassified Curtobacterium TaxID=257496 RepID=UPI0011B67672|nr:MULTISPECIES: hypothetical protein [unclassified Curtobacterium]WIE54123.1 hypothetical protein DEI88_013495 [Curtobacterium sp. MCBD17_003]